MKPLGATLLAVVAAGLVVGGCGGGDDGALDKGEFVAAAERICTRLDREGMQLARRYFGEDFSQAPSAEDHAEFFRRLIPGVEAGLAEIRALDGPDDGEALVERIIDSDPFVPLATQALRRYDAGDQAGFEEAVEDLFGGQGESPPGVEAQAVAYGLDGCVGDGGGD